MALAQYAKGRNLSRSWPARAAQWDQRFQMALKRVSVEFLEIRTNRNKFLEARFLQRADPRMRSRVPGVRMLAIYGLPMGLLASGPLIEAFGYAATTTGYGVFGVIATALIAWRWHAHIWRLDTVANRG